ncbi:hypothetical protein AB0F18_28440 [Streptomyces sp. NPDC029216]|uniref:hypothetical protein n=1 Tax=Streptomyces sp. NPDC029216 TaxID=3154701 RepID=UPI0033E71821
MTWEAIGGALGCSRQSAHERYAHHVKEQPWPWPAFDAVSTQGTTPTASGEK